MPGLLIDGVSHRYERTRLALDDVSLRLERGVLGLVGPNGAGKTTLLRILATLLVPTEGAVTWDGQDIVRQPVLLRRELGYVPQEFGVYPQLTAREFLSYIGELKGLRGADLRRRVATALETVRLAGDADRRLGTFSGGMVRRIGIAQALLANPRLLVLDEPTAGLDPAERVRFRETLAALPHECLVVLSTHIISDVEAVATDLALVRQGSLIWTGTPEGLLADAAECAWAITVSSAEFERLRATHQVSAAIRRGEMVEARLLARARPHPAAAPVTPTLEEAYLFFNPDAAMAQDTLAPV
ncbi:MAG TPA: ABC transporter ATP-binding protein [Ktedonobacterales bacterium]|jgi:ABC-2 type transport system ATP-binding protein